MITDAEILNLMLTRENYERFFHYINKNYLTQEGEIILKDIGAYYALDNELSYVDIAKFKVFFHNKCHPDMKKENIKLYNQIFDHISNIKHTIVEEDLVKLWKRQELDTKLREAAEEKSTVEQYYELLDKYTNEVDNLNEEDLVVSSDIKNILAQTDAEVKLNWRLGALNTALGPMHLGKFGIIASRPNSGKTSFLASEVSYMAEQLQDDQCILWLNNENRGVNIIQRLYCAFFNKSWQEIVSQKDRATEIYNKKGGNKVKVIDIHGKSVRDCMRLYEKIKPQLIIIDMLDHIGGLENKKNETVDTKYERLYQWALEFSCTKCPILATSQLRGDAEGIEYPDMSQLKGSTTAKQGAASFILMIGKSKDPFEDTFSQAKRYLSTPKNKFGSGYFQGISIFDTEKSRFK